jgi:hypothetical protein
MSLEQRRETSDSRSPGLGDAQTKLAKCLIIRVVLTEEPLQILAGRILRFSMFTESKKTGID